MLYPLSYGGGRCTSRGRSYSHAGRAPSPPVTGRAKRCRILHLHADGPRRRHRAAGAPPPAAHRVGGREGPPPRRWHRPARAGRGVRHAAVRLRRGRICATPAARPSRPGATASPTPPRPSCAAPWPGWPTRRACTSTSRPAASSTSRSRPASPPERLVLHGNNKSTDELATALRAGRRPHRRRLLRRDRPPRRPAGVRRTRHASGPRSSSGSRPASRRTRTSSCAPGRRTRSSASPSRRAPRPRRWPRSSSCPRVELVGVHAHIGSQVFDASSFEQAAEVLGAFFAPLGLPELVVGGGLGVPYVNGESAPTPGRVGRRDPRAPARRPGSTPPRGSRPSPGVPSSPPPASRCTRSAPSSTSRASAPT